MQNSPVLSLQKNGPIKVSGKFNIIDEKGNPVEASGDVWLCRCGHSSNKPFCDGTHKKGEGATAVPKESCD